jgi:hypothetical protein
VLKKDDNGRVLFKEIEGVDFYKQFEAYCGFYYNYRFGETTEAILQAILRKNVTVNGEQLNGEKIFKAHYPAKHEMLLKELCDKRSNAKNISERRLYHVLFTIVREELDTVHKFIK